MVFVREVVSQEYKGMLDSLGFTDVSIGLQSWTIDKERQIYMWTSRFPDRDERSEDLVLIWQNQVIELNVTTVVTSLRYPERDEQTGELIKGLNVKSINQILIPPSLEDQKKEVVDIIKEAMEHEDYRYDVEFRDIAEPQVQ